MSGIYVPWLADAARLTGYPVAELSGWKSRGHGGMTSVEGVVCHHTAGPKTGEYPSLQVVRDGRAGLPGPLANLGIGRSGTIYVVAAGLAYHAGVSSWAGYSDLNYRFLGIEAESTGLGTGDWTPEQLDCYPRLVAALLYYMRRNASRACAHRECAPGRKIDPTGIDMPAFRARVGQMLADPLHLIPRGGVESPSAPPALRLEDDMIYIKTQDPETNATWTGLLCGGVLMGFGSKGELDWVQQNIDKGVVPQMWVEKATWDAWAARNPRPDDVVALGAKLDAIAAKLDRLGGSVAVTDGGVVSS